MSESPTKDGDLDNLRRAIALAMLSRKNGNNPFGTVLADQERTILLEAENSTKTDRDCTAHSDINLIRNAWQKFDAEYLGECTLYTSAEPCAMCAGAIVWANIRRVVYSLGNTALYDQMNPRADGLGLYTPCREIFNGAPWKIKTIGPLLEEEASKVHQDFWQK